MAKVAVVGGGPAGITAAIQLSRSGHVVTLYERRAIGGTVRNARLVENYAGFPNGINGTSLAKLLSEQLSSFVTDVRTEEVDEIVFDGGKYSVTSVKGSAIFDGVIVCTGTKPKAAGFEGEGNLSEAGHLHYEIADIGELAPGASVGIVGGGEASMDYAIHLWLKGKKVTVIHRSEPCGIKAVYDKSIEHCEIAWLPASVLQGYEKDGKVELDMEDGHHSFDRLLVAVGREPTKPRLTGTDHAPQGTFFMAGDVIHGRLGQVAIAVGEGMKAAIALDNVLGGGE